MVCLVGGTVPVQYWFGMSFCPDNNLSQFIRFIEFLISELLRQCGIFWFSVLILKRYCFLLRYVREWLGSMVAAEVVLMTEDNRYYIPHEVLPDIKGLAIFTAVLPASAKRIDDLYNCFQLDGPRGNTDAHFFINKLTYTNGQIS